MYKNAFHGLSRHVQYRHRSVLVSKRPLFGYGLMTPKPSVYKTVPRRTFLSKLFGGFTERNNSYVGQAEDALSFIRHLSKNNPTQCIKTLEGNNIHLPLSLSPGLNASFYYFFAFLLINRSSRTPHFTILPYDLLLMLCFFLSMYNRWLAIQNYPVQRDFLA